MSEGSSRSSQVGRVSDKAYDMLRKRALELEPVAEAQDDKRTRSQGRLATAAIIALCSLPKDVTLAIATKRLSGEELGELLVKHVPELRAQIERREKAKGPAAHIVRSGQRGR